MDKDDILLWQDGFWCLRGELDKQLLRNAYYRVIPCSTDEWLALLAAKPSLGHAPA